MTTSLNTSAFNTADYRKEVETTLKGLRDRLARLQDGQSRHGTRTGDEPWRDTTDEYAAFLRHNIRTYQTILAAMDTGALS
jgi:hypothetical protein